MKINSQPHPYLFLLPLGSPKKFDYSHNFTIFDHEQLFPQNTWRVQIFGYNIGRVELYQNNYTTLSRSIPLPWQGDGWEKRSCYFIDRAQPLVHVHDVAKFELAKCLV